MIFKKMDKKGDLIATLSWVSVSFIILIFFAAWIFAHAALTNALVNLPPAGNINVSSLAQQTFGQIDSALSSLKILAFLMIFAIGLSTLITGALTKSNPVFFIVHIFVTVVVFVFGVEISNAYEGLLSNPLLGSTLLEFTGGNHIMLNLPTYVVIFGIMGAVIISIGLIRDRGAGGSPI